MNKEVARKIAILKATVLDNPYIEEKPTLKQADFLVNDNKEILFGGAAGGGKSSALLMAALQYVGEPKYSALILRRTYADLSLPGAIMDRAKTWLIGKDCRWNDKEKTFFFPSGATLTFGYLENLNDIYRYQGAEFQFIAFDELTQFREAMFLYLFSRLRKNDDNPVPLRMRAGSNPGGVGHEWVFDRFFIQNEKDRLFIPSLLDDNPHINKTEYESSLAKLDPITREQLRNGNWTVRNDGGYFKREWFEIVDEVPKDMRKVRFWDMAGTKEEGDNDPDYSSGTLMGEKDGIYYIEDIVRFRNDPSDSSKKVKNTADMDSRKVDIWMEQEPGSAGKYVIADYSRNVLRGFTFKGERSSGSKVERAKPFSAAASNKLIKVKRAHWNSEFFNEIEGFPYGAHDDQVDSTSGAFNKLQAPRVIAMKNTMF